MSAARRPVTPLRIGLGLVLLLGLMQLVPVSRTNPPIASEPAWDSPRTAALARKACYDCHSHEVRWPWYGNVAPVSSLVAHHVNHGREYVNFHAAEKGDVTGTPEQVHSGAMPLPMYLWLHPEARLTDEEREELAAGLARTFGSTRP